MKKALFLLLSIFFINSCVNNQKQISLNKNKISAAYAPIPQSNYSFVQAVNDIRAKGSSCAGPAAPLKTNIYLEKAAMSHAKDMALHSFVGHFGSGDYSDIAKKAPGKKSSFIDRILYFGYPAKTYDLIGENTTRTRFSEYKTKDINEHFKFALEKFLKDPPHCKILMNPRFKDIGIGYYRGTDGYYWVFDFGETTPN